MPRLAVVGGAAFQIALAAPRSLTAQAAPAPPRVTSLAPGTRVRYGLGGLTLVQADLLAFRYDSLELSCFEPCPTSAPLRRQVALADLRLLQYQRGTRATLGFLVGAGVGLSLAGVYVFRSQDHVYAPSSARLIGFASTGVLAGGLLGLIGRSIGSSSAVWVTVPLPQ